jgi:hypothetical protein
MATEVLKIVLKVKDMAIELTADEAKGLRDALVDLFGAKAQIVEIRTEPARGYPWVYPWWMVQQPTTTAPYEITWCSSSDSTV